MPKSMPKSILVVDDDDSIRRLCAEVLTVAGYQVKTAIHGAMGLEMLDRFRFDLVLSDVSMPEMGGVEFYGAALAANPDLKERFLFMTGDPGNLDGMFADPVGKVLPKPFRITDLIGFVDNVMLVTIEEFEKRSERGKRVENRFCIETECDIFEEGPRANKVLIARTLDASRHGVRIAYEGDPLARNKHVNAYLSISSLCLIREATVVWSAPGMEGTNLSGLKLKEPMPISSIVNLMPSRQERKAQ